MAMEAANIKEYEIKKKALDSNFNYNWATFSKSLHHQLKRRITFQSITHNKCIQAFTRAQA